MILTEQQNLIYFVDDQPLAYFYDSYHNAIYLRSVLNVTVKAVLGTYLIDNEFKSAFNVEIINKQEDISFVINMLTKLMLVVSEKVKNPYFIIEKKEKDKISSNISAEGFYHIDNNFDFYPIGVNKKNETSDLFKTDIPSKAYDLISISSNEDAMTALNRVKDEYKTYPVCIWSIIMQRGKLNHVPKNMIDEYMSNLFYHSFKKMPNILSTNRKFFPPSFAQKVEKELIAIDGNQLFKIKENKWNKELLLLMSQSDNTDVNLCKKAFDYVMRTNDDVFIDQFFSNISANHPVALSVVDFDLNLKYFKSYFYSPNQKKIKESFDNFLSTTIKLAQKNKDREFIDFLIETEYHSINYIDDPEFFSMTFYQKYLKKLSDRHDIYLGNKKVYFDTEEKANLLKNIGISPMSLSNLNDNMESLKFKMSTSLLIYSFDQIFNTKVWNSHFSYVRNLVKSIKNNSDYLDFYLFILKEERLSPDRKLQYFYPEFVYEKYEDIETLLKTWNKEKSDKDWIALLESRLTDVVMDYIVRNYSDEEISQFFNKKHLILPKYKNYILENLKLI